MKYREVRTRVKYEGMYECVYSYEHELVFHFQGCDSLSKDHNNKINERKTLMKTENTKKLLQ